MLEVGGDDMIAGLEGPLDRDVQSVGAIEREDPALGRGALEELVEHVTSRVKFPFGGDSHPVPCPARVRQAGAGEMVKGLIDGLGLGEAGGGVVEVNHYFATIFEVGSPGNSSISFQCTKHT